MVLLQCKECGHEISSEAVACPSCGKLQTDRPPSSSIGAQVRVYLVSLLLPPFGLRYVWKYAHQNDRKSKNIALAALILTALSVIVSVWLFAGLVDSVNEAVDSLNQYTY